MSIGIAIPARRLDGFWHRFEQALPLDRRAFSLAAGIRAATACAIPVLIAELTGRQELSWIAIVAFWGCQADPGGAWRARFLAMSSFTLLATFGCFIALAAEPRLWLSVPLVFLWSFCGSFARIFGNAATTVGVLLTVDVIVCLGTASGSFTEALDRTGLTFAGGLWSMLLVLVIWRLYPYGPARRAVGDCWRTLGQFAHTLGELQAGQADEAAWANAMRDRRGAVRSAIEAARTVVTYDRRRNAGQSARGELLVVLLADADQIFEALIALSEMLEQPHMAISPRVRRTLRTALLRFARQATALGQGLEKGTPGRRRHRSLALMRRRLNELRMVEAAMPESITLLERVTHYLQIAAETASGIRPQRTLSEAMADGPGGPLVDWAAVRASIRGNLGWGSLNFRHALRVAVTAAIAETVILESGIARGYWLSITAIVILQPFMATTWRRSIERVIGSVLGGVIAAAIGGLIHSPLLIAVLIFPLSVITMAVKSVNYTLFVLCLTPQFVLIAELFQTGQFGGWSLAGLRAVDSTIGGLLGLIAGFVCWPSWEEPQLKSRLADALAATRTYLAAVFARGAEAEQETSQEALQAARRAAGLASANAEASLQRVFAEPRRTQPETVEAGITLVTCMRRLAGVAAALSLLPDIIDPKAREAWIDQSVHWTMTTFDGLAASLKSGEPPPPLAPMPPMHQLEATETSLLHHEMARMRRQTEIIQAAVERLNGRADLVH